MSYGFHRIGANARIRDGIVEGNGLPMPVMVFQQRHVAVVSAEGALFQTSVVQDAASWSLPPAVADTLLEQPGITKANARELGFTGSVCGQCGSYQMVRNGTCEKCTACGSTTGCS